MVDPAGRAALDGIVVRAATACIFSFRVSAGSLGRRRSCSRPLPLRPKWCESSSLDRSPRVRQGRRRDGLNASQLQFLEIESEVEDHLYGDTSVLILIVAVDVD